MGGHRIFAAAGVVALGVAVWIVSRLEFGDVDPLSAGIGFASFVVGVASLVVAVRAWRRQETDTTQLADRLARKVRDREQQARRQLLGEPGRTIDVAFDFRPAPGHNASDAARQGRLGAVADYYRRLRPRRMVITGAAGAGKTVLAVELVMALLEDRAAADPVPVRLSASSWAEADGAARMESWLTAHLITVYELRRREALALVEAGLVLPVVDGLDELDATDRPGYGSRAGQMLRVFNGYQRYRSRAGLIVTCRTEHYQALVDDRAWMEDAARVEIQSVSSVQAREFIAARAVDTARWRTVLDVIKRDRGGPLAQGLATPWRLTLAVVVYEQRDASGAFLRDPEHLTGPEFGTPEALRDHLLELFIPAALQSSPGRRYDAGPARRWLTVLAGYLRRNTEDERRVVGGRRLSGTDIVLHELWPLGGFLRPRLVVAAAIVTVWAVLLLTFLDREPDGMSWMRMMSAGVGTGVLALCGLLSWFTPWPEPQQFNVRLLSGKYLVVGIAAAVFVAVTFMTAVLLMAPPVGLRYTVGVALQLGFGMAIIVTLVAVLVARPTVDAPDPRAMVRESLRSELFSAAAIGSVSIFLGGPFALLGILGGMGLPITNGGAGLRYVGLLVCTRRGSGRWLPWRLGRFLHACYEAGLIRIAGDGYQFRHRELQDYLARHPAP